LTGTILTSAVSVISTVHSSVFEAIKARIALVREGLEISLENAA
jgi:hypothetical protein